MDRNIGKNIEIIENRSSNDAQCGFFKGDFFFWILIIIAILFLFGGFDCFLLGNKK